MFSQQPVVPAQWNYFSFGPAYYHAQILLKGNGDVIQDPFRIIKIHCDIGDAFCVHGYPPCKKEGGSIAATL